MKKISLSASHLWLVLTSGALLIGLCRLTALAQQAHSDAPANASQQYTTVIAQTITQQNAANTKQMQEAQAAVQSLQSQLAQAISKSNGGKNLTAKQRADVQAQIRSLRQQLTARLMTLNALQVGLNRPGANLGQLQVMPQWQARGAMLLAPNTPASILPQDRNLLFTPKDAATLITRNLLLTPADRAATKTIPLDKATGK